MLGKRLSATEGSEKEEMMSLAALFFREEGVLERLGIWFFGRESRRQGELVYA
jgi:hypothetical protein